LRAIGVIPSRYSSSRFPGKPLATVLGQPLILWVARGVAESKLLDGFKVATDDERILDAVRAEGFEAVMTGGDLRSGSDRVWEAAREDAAEIIVNIQGDEAAVSGNVVDSCIRPLMQRDDVDVVTLRTPMTDARELRDPNAVKVVTDAEGFALYFSRSAIPHSTGDPVGGLHYRHVGIYAYRREALKRFCGLPRSQLEETERLEQLRGLEAGMRYLVLESSYKSIDINTPADLERAAGELGLHKE